MVIISTIVAIVTIFAIVAIGEMFEITILFRMAYITTSQESTVRFKALFTREAIVCYLSGADIFQYFPNAIHHHLAGPVVIVSIEHQYPANPGFRVEKQERYYAGVPAGMPRSWCSRSPPTCPRCRIRCTGCARYTPQTE
jgi:hypothetical protein